jgi:FixJ family two-component response regulator
MTASNTMVFVVEDDASMRHALKNLLRSVGLTAQLFASAQEFLNAHRPDVGSCLILDVRLRVPAASICNDSSAQQTLQFRLSSSRRMGIFHVGARYESGSRGVPNEPFRDQDLLDAIQVALQRDRERREGERQVASLQSRLQALTTASVNCCHGLFQDDPTRRLPRSWA